MDSDNLSRQVEEVEALSAIYGNDWTTESEASRSYRINVVENKNEAILYVTMPPEYPSQAPPKYELSAPWMDRKAKENMHRALDEVYLENIGETVIYQWVEKIREILQAIKPLNSEKNSTDAHLYKINHSQDGPMLQSDKDLGVQLYINCPNITHGEVITDRKSVFQGHAAEVHSMEDIKAVLSKLKDNKKIANATHNMYAYRYERRSTAERGGSVTLQQDCDDDGENHAGGRMLHLLQITRQVNVLVVVSRWYGGIQLGPDRFRHINNATRQVLEQAGFIKK